MRLINPRSNFSPVTFFFFFFFHEIKNIYVIYLHEVVEFSLARRQKEEKVDVN